MHNPSWIIIHQVELGCILVKKSFANLDFAFLCQQLHLHLLRVPVGPFLARRQVRILDSAVYQGEQHGSKYIHQNNLRISKAKDNHPHTVFILKKLPASSTSNHKILQWSLKTPFCCDFEDLGGLLFCREIHHLELCIASPCMDPTGRLVRQHALWWTFCQKTRSYQPVGVVLWYLPFELRSCQNFLASNTSIHLWCNGKASMEYV